MDDYELMEDYFEFEEEDVPGSYEDDYEAYLGEEEEWEAYGGDLEMWESNGNDYEEWEAYGGDFEDWGSYEGVYEADPFFGSLIKRFIPKKLKQYAHRAAQTAGAAIGQQIGGRRGRQLGMLAGNLAGRFLSESEYSGEYEDEYEGDWEAEVGDYELLEEMSYLAEQAASANTDEEADQFFGALASLAAPLLAKAAPAIASAAPGLLSKGIKAIGSLFKRRRRRRSRRRREFEAFDDFESMEAEDAVIKALPEITAKTVTSLAKQANAGKQVTPERIAATIAKKTTQVIANPRKLARAAQANQAKARRVAQRGGPRKYARRCQCCGKVVVRAKAPRMV